MLFLDAYAELGSSAEWKNLWRPNNLEQFGAKIHGNTNGSEVAGGDADGGGGGADRSYKQHAADRGSSQRISATTKFDVPGGLKGRKRPLLLIASGNVSVGVSVNVSVGVGVSVDVSMDVDVNVSVAVNGAHP